MRTHITFALVAACVGCGGAPSRAQSAPPSTTQVASLSQRAQSTAPTPPATFEVAAIDDYIARQVAARGFVGLSIAIVKDGAIVLDKGYGKSQLAPDAPVKADTAFAIGSVSKQFVASAVLLLADEKKLSLDDKVAKYFPDLTRAGDITLYDLMSHLSGYRDNYPLDFVDREMKQPITPDESIALYAKRPLDFEPRTRRSYSNTGYVILGRVIEKVTGKPLGAVLNERIFRPLGMTHTSYLPADGTPGLARGYTSFAFGPPEPAELEARGWLFGAAGIYAPAGDIAKWNIALMSGKVLGPEAYKVFSTPRSLADGRMSRYGCGISITVNKGGDTVLQHDGAVAGFLTFSLLIPRTRSAVVAISNRDDVHPAGLVNDIVALLDKEHVPPPLKVAGPSAQEVARDVFAQIQSGRVDRRRFGDDFNDFLTNAKLQGASSRLQPLGTPTDIDVEETHERGGMQVAAVRFTFSTMKLKAVMFQSVDGKVQQFLINKL